MSRFTDIPDHVVTTMIVTDNRIAYVLSRCSNHYSSLFDNNYWWKQYCSSFVEEQYDEKENYRERYVRALFIDPHLTSLVEVSTEEEMRLFLRKNCSLSANWIQFLARMGTGGIDQIRLIKMVLNDRRLNNTQYRDAVAFISGFPIQDDEKRYDVLEEVIVKLLSLSQIDQGKKLFISMIEKLWNWEFKISPGRRTSFVEKLFRVNPIPLIKCALSVYERYLVHRPNTLLDIAYGTLNIIEGKQLLKEFLENRRQSVPCYHLTSLIKICNNDDESAREYLSMLTWINNHAIDNLLYDGLLKGLNPNYVDDDGHSFYYRVSEEIRKRNLSASGMGIISSLGKGIVSTVTKKDLYKIGVSPVSGMITPKYLDLDCSYEVNGKNCLFHSIGTNQDNTAILLSSLRLNKQNISLSGCLHRSIKYRANPRIIETLLELGADKEEFIDGERPIEYLKRMISLLERCDEKIMAGMSYNTRADILILYRNIAKSLQ